MQRRLFIAINLPEDIKNRIKGIVHEVQPLLDGEIRFLKPNNWHITITFLGYQEDEAVPAITKSLQSTTQNYSHILENMRIVLDRISFGPLGKRPRMIWLVADNETSRNLAALKNKLEDELIKNDVRFRKEKRGLGNAHITLARFQVGQINLSDVRLPNIEKLSFNIESLDLMESHLKRTGAEYDVLARVDFEK